MFTPPPHVLEAYEQPHRFYHGMGHIVELLGLIRSLPVSEDEREHLEILAWYHDVVHETDQPHGWNEQQSAERFEQDAPIHQMNVTDGKEAILATARHLQDQTGLSPLQALFLDIDLAGLGTDDGTFERHGELILKEYTHAGYSEEEVMKGRAQFYERMLQREHIFYTSFFQDRENQARANMQQALMEMNANKPVPRCGV